MKDTIIQITSNGMGNGDLELQQKLIVTYLKLLDENNIKPNAITFYTEGIKLLVEGSPALDLLENLEKKGVRLIACGTCLSFYNLSDKLKVGIIGGMTDMLEAQQKAAKVISL